MTVSIPSWEDFGTILHRWRSRIVAWPAEIDCYILKSRRAKGGPRVLTASDVDLLRRVLLRRFPPHNGGLHVRMWDNSKWTSWVFLRNLLTAINMLSLDESSGDFPVVFITTEGSYYSLQGKMAAQPCELSFDMLSCR